MAEAMSRRVSGRPEAASLPGRRPARHAPPRPHDDRADAAGHRHPRDEADRASTRPPPPCRRRRGHPGPACGRPSSTPPATGADLAVRAGGRGGSGRSRPRCRDTAARFAMPRAPRLAARPSEHRGGDGVEGGDGRRSERPEGGVHVGDAGLDLAGLVRREVMPVLADESRVVGGSAQVAVGHDDDVPVVSDLVGFVRVEAERAPPDLLDRHARRRGAEVDEHVRRPRVPALAEQRAGADEAARTAGLVEARHEWDPAAG